ncbi:glycosyltransferase family 8 protein [Falsirhodobacter sp. 20TX0035]|uniref:glycosyltransferase family 8 protein n=1 Tax=Falsirhodobacter sp. 20TX0035 TaxID=3022019 RepID=UPI00232AAE13|nr:glycosyltransferase family 8 protein [Falsirhodobacter sp. 20TX0035]MDB6454461.1 glycosyltransferase family 8 protein [Falsirhodobacter sp. 20TX0035]
MREQNIRIAYGTDMGLIGPTALSLDSAIRCTPGLSDVDILSVSLDHKATDLLRRIAANGNVSLHIHPMRDEHFESARHKGKHVPKAALARMFLPRLVDGRVLYIDGDTLVRRDLAPVFGTPLNGNLIGAVRDFGCSEALSRIRRGKSWSYKGATKDAIETVVAPYDADSYINSGVILMDCAAIRDEDGLAETMVQFERAAAFRTVDQDFSNALFKGRIQHLNPAWNASWGRSERHRSWIRQMGHEGPETFREKDGILHFHGPFKPWKALPRNRWKRNPLAVGAYKLALWSFRRRYPDVAFD